PSGTSGLVPGFSSESPENCRNATVGASSLIPMTADLNLHGVWVPLITPFDARGDVDTDAIGRLCHEYLRAGARGIVALGTTGESPALDAKEKRAVVDACSAVCAEVGAPLIVGTGTNSTRTTIQETLELTDAPAVVGALVVVPYYVRPSDEGVLAHYG